MDTTAADTEAAARLAELTAAAHRERDARICRRMLAVRHVLAGHGVGKTAGVFAVGRTQLYAWLGRYRAEGIRGLADRPRPGAAPHLASEHEAAFLERLHAGPPADSGLSEYRGEDVRRLLAQEFGAHYSLSGVYALLHRLEQSSLVPRPRHPDADAAAQAAFKK